MERAIVPRKITDVDVAAILNFKKTVVLGLNGSTFEDKRQILNLLQVTVFVNDYEVTVRCCFANAAGKSFESAPTQATIGSLGLEINEKFDLADAHGWAARRHDLEKNKKPPT